MSEEGKKKIPKATWEGTFTVFGVILRCAVLDDEVHTRVINAEDLPKLFEVMGSPFSFGMEPGDLEEFTKWQQGL